MRIDGCVTGRERCESCPASRGGARKGAAEGAGVRLYFGGLPEEPSGGATLRLDVWPLPRTALRGLTSRAARRTGYNFFDLHLFCNWTAFYYYFKCHLDSYYNLCHYFLFVYTSDRCAIIINVKKHCYLALKRNLPKRNIIKLVTEFAKRLFVFISIDEDGFDMPQKIAKFSSHLWPLLIIPT